MRLTSILFCIFSSRFGVVNISEIDRDMISGLTGTGTKNAELTGTGTGIINQHLKYRDRDQDSSKLPIPVDYWLIHDHNLVLKLV